MEEGHYAPVSFGSRSNSPEVGNASTKLLDWEHASYGTEEMRVSINTGSAQMKRMGSGTEVSALSVLSDENRQGREKEGDVCDIKEITRECPSYNLLHTK
ncbi:hypothetical protein DIPPA_33036 [Diplonema papillatum]|nr:hypothetical protein DIPPA_33036 [Diplonema papillatum]